MTASPASTSTSILRRHPGLALLAINVAIFVFAAGVAEIALRLYVPYNPGYYMSVEGTSREVVYPYGTIRINSQGFPDDEFETTKQRPRVGYFGDSVTYGVGAGYGHRFSELLAESYPGYEHMNFAGIGLSVSQATIANAVALADQFDLDVVVYIFNLNDIVPDAVVSGSENSIEADMPLTRRVSGWLFRNVDWLRGRSYLYTYVRTLAKNFLEARGIGFHGYLAYELFPEEQQAVVVETAHRIDLFHDELARRGVDFVLVLLPYEMQISEEAEHTYAAHGIHWEEGFIGGSTQRSIVAHLDPDVRAIDLLPAFVDPDDGGRSRKANGVGSLFVYNRGDKLDWNHPNREGHRRIADYLARVQLLAPTDDRESTHAHGTDSRP